MKPFLRVFGRVAHVIVAISTLAGCERVSVPSSAESGGSSAGGAPGAPDEEVFVLSYWMGDRASGGLGALYDTAAAFESQYEGVAVVPVAVTEQELVQEAISRTTLSPEGQNVFQRPDYQSLLELHRSGAVLDLTELFADETWSSAIPEDLLDDGFRVEGKPAAIPTNMQRVNVVHYNKPLLESYGFVPPKTLGQFKELVQDLREAGAVPLLMGNASGDPLWQFAYQCLAPHVMGPRHARDFFQGLSTGDDEKFIELLNTVLFFRCGPAPDESCDGYFNQDTDDMDEGAATSAFIEGFRGGAPYALYPSGSWVQAELSAAGLSPGIDFDVFTCPVASAADTGVFVGRPEGWMVGAGSDSGPLAIELARYLGSVEGQVSLNARQGSIPARTDIDPAEYGDVFDVLQSRALRDLASQPYWHSGQKPGTLPNHADELKAAMQAGSIEIVANYVLNNYETLIAD